MTWLHRLWDFSTSPAQTSLPLPVCNIMQTWMVFCATWQSSFSLRLGLPEPSNDSDMAFALAFWRCVIMQFSKKELIPLCSRLVASITSQPWWEASFFLSVLAQGLWTTLHAFILNTSLPVLCAWGRLSNPALGLSRYVRRIFYTISLIPLRVPILFTNRRQQTFSWWSESHLERRSSYNYCFVVLCHIYRTSALSKIIFKHMRPCKHLTWHQHWLGPCLDACF